MLLGLISSSFKERIYKKKNFCNSSSIFVRDMENQRTQPMLRNRLQNSLPNAIHDIKDTTCTLIIGEDC